MAVSGTTAFNLDFAELAEEAFERAGKCVLVMTYAQLRDP